MQGSPFRSGSGRILIVVKDREINNLINKTLTANGMVCNTTFFYTRAKTLLTHNEYNLMISDRSYQNKTGEKWYDAIQREFGQIGIVLAASQEGFKRRPCVDQPWFCGVITTPVEPIQVMITVKMALTIQQMANTLNGLSQIVASLISEQLEKEKALNAMDQALGILLVKREKDKIALEAQIVQNIRSVIIPNIERLQKFRLSPRHLRMLDLIETNLKDIASPFIKSISAAYIDLTPQEIQVADLIKQGKPTKEIASILNLSTNTIMTHRYHIRSKLGLKNKKTHLATFLNTLTNQ